MAQLAFRVLGEEHDAAYDQFVENHGTVFAQRDWLRQLKGETTLLGLFNGSDQLVGAFPCQSSKRLGLRTVKRPPYTPYSGPYYSPELSSSKGSLEHRRFFATEIASYLERTKTALCQLSLDPEIQDCLPFRWKGFKVVPAYTYRIALSQSEEQIQANFSSTRRRNIRAAIRDSIDIRPVDSYEIIGKLAQRTFARQAKKLPLSTMRRILNEFASPANSFAFAAYQGGMPVAGVFCVYDRRNVYYLIGGYLEENSHHGAGAACMRAAILKAKSLGKEVFDFEGSVIPAIERYFRGFGGTLTPYFTINRAWLPIELLLKYKKREIF